jgi:hypothetical protein
MKTETELRTTQGIGLGKRNRPCKGIIIWSLFSNGPYLFHSEDTEISSNTRMKSKPGTPAGVHVAAGTLRRPLEELSTLTAASADKTGT